MSIFYSIQQLQDCERVLKALAGTDHDDEEYLLHDRTRTEHTRSLEVPYQHYDPYEPPNRQYGRCDHGGPFVVAFLELPDDPCLTDLPHLVRKVSRATPQDLSNSRYTRFKLSEVKDYLTQDLLWAMEYYEVREAAEQEADLPQQWADQVARHYPEYQARKMRITLVPEKQALLVSLLDPYRANLHGFGTYLEDIQPGEVSVSQSAYLALSEAQKRDCGGLPTMMAWDGVPKGPILGGMFRFQTLIPVTEISIPPSAKEALLQVVVVE